MTTAVASPDPSTNTTKTTTNNNKTPPPPTPPSPRFTLELEFVLSLANPYYLSHLALTYPHLLNPPPPPSKDPRTTSSSQRLRTDNAPSTKATTQPESDSDADSDASRFASYLAYLYSYWRRPEYARFLTHPGATLRNLQLLQQDRFRRDIIRPDVIEKLLLAVGTGEKEEEEGEGEGEGKEEKKKKKGDTALAAAAGEEGGGREVKEDMELRGNDEGADVAATAAAGEQEPKINEAQEESAMDVAVG